MNSVTVLKLRNTMRLIAAASAVVIATGAGSAFASVTVDSSNDTTGNGSVQDNTVDVDNDLDVDFENDADIDEDIDFVGESGNNLVAANTTVEDNTSGDLGVEIELANEANNGSAMGDIAFGDMDVEADFSNNITGNNSENFNDLNVENDVDVDFENDADVDTDIDLTLNSGSNIVRGNTTVGDNTSGDIDVDLSVENEVNSGAGIDLGDLGFGDVDFTAENGTTGRNSLNENTVNVENDIDVDVTNDAEIDTNINVDANSGGNTLRGNTTVGNNGSGAVNFSYSGRNAANNR